MASQSCAERIGMVGKTPAASTYLLPGRRSRFIFEIPSHLLMNGSASLSQVSLSNKPGSGKRWQLWQTERAIVADCSSSGDRARMSGRLRLFVSIAADTELVLAGRGFESGSAPVMAERTPSKESEPSRAPGKKRPQGRPG